MSRPPTYGVSCGHVGAYWRIPLWPWIKPHWYCRHCRRRLPGRP